MSENPIPEHHAISPRRSANGRTPPGYRVLHVIVPEMTFNHLKAQSYLLGMRFPEYVVRHLEGALPHQMSPTTSNHTSVPASDPADAARVGHDCEKNRSHFPESYALNECTEGA